jgi:hypothetical protein
MPEVSHFLEFIWAKFDFELSCSSFSQFSVDSELLIADGPRSITDSPPVIFQRSAIGLPSVSVLCLAFAVCSRSVSLQAQQTAVQSNSRRARRRSGAANRQAAARPAGGQQQPAARRTFTQQPAAGK